jgi:hypothetical protein
MVASKHHQPEIAWPEPKAEVADKLIAERQASAHLTD